MGDLKVGESFEDRVYIVNSTGAAQTGLSPTCTIIDESGNRGAGTVAEMASGWYKVTDFTPDAAGTWCLEWVVSGAYTVMHPAKEFKVGGGTIADVETELTFQHQADAILNQGTPVQNTWYTALDTTLNCRLITISAGIRDTNETLEMQLTIDGNTISVPGKAATANTNYFLRASSNYNQGLIFELDSAIYYYQRAFLIECRSVKVEIRKTTAAGTGDLRCTIGYAKR